VTDRTSIIAITLTGGAEETVGADLGESLGQDVLEEASEEVVGGESQPLRLLRAGRDVAEGDPVAELRPLARSHQRLIYGVLLTEAAHSLQLLADDPKWVGATLGMLAVLHTWSRDLAFHPHVHLLVTARGLTSDGQAWRKPAHRKFLVPGFALSKIFRAKVRDALHRSGLDVDAAVFKKPWTVHLQHAGDGRHVGEYLSRYAYRVAITNDRLERFDGRTVTFRYVSSRTRATERLTLPVGEFLGRFLQHVLPKGFTKIRAYGLFSPAASKRRGRARHLLALDPRRPQAAPAPEPAATATPVRACPVCSSGRLIRRFTCHQPLAILEYLAAAGRSPP
jgi:hypothetical protein